MRVHIKHEKEDNKQEIDSLSRNLREDLLNLIWERLCDSLYILFILQKNYVYRYIISLSGLGSLHELLPCD